MLCFFSPSAFQEGWKERGRALKGWAQRESGVTVFSRIQAVMAMLLEPLITRERNVPQPGCTELKDALTSNNRCLLERRSPALLHYVQPHLCMQTGRQTKESKQRGIISYMTMTQRPRERTTTEKNNHNTIKSHVPLHHVSLPSFAMLAIYIHSQA
jgi:hypothetical protein